MQQDFVPRTAPTNGADHPLPPITVANREELGTTKGIFNTIRDNPGRSRHEVIEALVKAGYNVNSVSSLMGAMVSGKLIKYDGHGGMLTTRKNYRALGNPYDKTRLKAKAKAKANGVNIDKVHKKVKRPKPLLPKERLTRSEAGEMANMLRWAQWGKMADKWGKEFMHAKRREWNRLHPNYSVAEASKKLGEAIKAGRAASKVTVNVARANLEAAKKAQDKPTASVAEKARAVGRKVLDSAKPARHSAPPTEQNAALDLRSMTADDVVQGMSLTQAREVFNKLRGYFKD